MKNTGIIRHVDKLDRIVIPKELCKNLGIEPKAALEIFVENTRIVLKKHETEGVKNKGGIGVVRRVDSLDRIVIPKEMCKILGVEPGDALEIFVDDTRIFLEKAEQACVFCREAKNITVFKDKPVCEKCIRELAKTV